MPALGFKQWVTSIREGGFGITAFAMKPMVSKAWSCDSLKQGLNRVQSHYGHLQADELSESDMLQELADPCKTL